MYMENILYHQIFKQLGYFITWIFFACKRSNIDSYDDEQNLYDPKVRTCIFFILLQKNINLSRMSFPLIYKDVSIFNFLSECCHPCKNTRTCVTFSMLKGLFSIISPIFSTKNNKTERRKNIFKVNKVNLFRSRVVIVSQ